METQIIPPIKSPTPKPLKMPRIYPAQLDPSCVAYYDFSEGPKLYDFSGHLNHGTIYGATFVAQGRQGTALLFDGLDDYVSMGVNGPSLSEIAGDKLTINIGLTPNDIINQQQITTKNGPYLIDILSGKIRYRLYATTLTVLEGSETLITTNRYLFTMVYDGSNMMIYVNGKLDVSVGKTGDLTGNGCMQIGRFNSGGCETSPLRYLKGSIDHLAIYNRAFTANEIIRIYESGQ